MVVIWFQKIFLNKKSVHKHRHLFPGKPGEIQQTQTGTCQNNWNTLKKTMLLSPLALNSMLLIFSLSSAKHHLKLLHCRLKEKIGNQRPF